MTVRPIVRLGAAAVLLALVAGGAQADRERSALEPAARPASDGLAARGRVHGLFPGMRTRMPVTVRNLTQVPLELRRIAVRVAPASPGCLARYLVVRRFRGERIVPARGTVQVRLKVRLRRSAPDACQGRRFPLAFVAEGVPA
jgi:hypothetical protein